eukprot:3249356-Amphidinium_carterae.2
MTPNEGATWLTTFLALAKTPQREGQKLGSHSLKATILSWAAKWGMSSDIRRALGQHFNLQDRSVDVYSRDQVAPCLRSLSATFIQPEEKAPAGEEVHTPTELADHSSLECEDAHDSFEKASSSTEASDDSSLQKANAGTKTFLLDSAPAREMSVLINQKSGKVHVRRGTRPACVQIEAGRIDETLDTFCLRCFAGVVVV